MVAFFRLQDECDGEDPSLSFCVAFTLEAGKVESSPKWLKTCFTFESKPYLINISMSSHSSSNLIRLAPHSEVVTVPVAEYYVVSWKYFWLLVMVSRICWESLEFFRQVAWAKGGQEKWLETHPWFRKGFVWLKCVAVPCLPFDPLFILCNFLCKGKLRAFYRQVSSTDSSFPSALAIYNKRVSFPKKGNTIRNSTNKNWPTYMHIYIYIWEKIHHNRVCLCVCVCEFLRFLTRIFWWILWLGR